MTKANSYSGGNLPGIYGRGPALFSQHIVDERVITASSGRGTLNTGLRGAGRRPMTKGSLSVINV